MKLNFSFTIFCIFIQIIESNFIDMEFSKDKIYRFEKFLMPCDGSKRVGYYTNVSVSKENKYHFNYDYVISKNINPDQISMHYTKCPSKETLDSCSFLKTLTIRNPCKYLPNEHEIFTPMLACSEPKWLCPFQKGVYRGRDCWLDFSSFNWFPVGSSYWKFKVQLLEKKKELSCTYFEGSVIRLV